MPTKQKLLLSISLLTLILPELLWSPIINMVYSLTHYSNRANFIRPNILMSSDYRPYLVFILAVQFLAVVVFNFFWFKFIVQKNKTALAIFIQVLSFLILLLNVFVLYIVAGMYNIG